MHEINLKNQSMLYDNLSINTLKNLVEKIGLSECPDIKSFEEYIDDNMSILDIGSGYGRAIDYLIKMDRNLSVTGIELNKNYFMALKKKYNNVHLLNECILHNNIKDTFDIVLMLWCFIYELSDFEISKLLTKIKKSITENSYLFVDVLNEGAAPSNAIHIKNDIYETNYGGYTNIKKNNDIIDMFSQFGFIFIDKLYYATTANSKLILVFKKLNDGT
jgi:SAM-dependent methyltransferase